MKKVLIVDDDPDIVTVVTILLKLNGFEVHSHPNGYDVPEVIENFHPDVVLLDINLSGVSGLDICNELKAISDHPPIILFSASNSEKASLASCKADGYLPKPFEVKNMLEKINKYAN